MTEYVLQLICALIVPMMMVFFGLILLKHAPALSGAFGYRTSFSMKNDETWIFAQHRCGRLWLILGLALTSAALAVFALLLKRMDALEKTAIALMLLEMAALLITIIPVERALRRNFDKDGKRKE